MSRRLASAAILAIAAGAVAVGTANAQTIRQLTDARAGNSLFPRLDATGGTVVWPASINPLGTNGEHAFQFFRGGAALTASVSDDGQRIGFTSVADPTGGNGDHSQETFVVDWDGAGETSSPSVSADGAKIAFTALGNITGANPDQTPETYLIERNRPWSIVASGAASPLVCLDEDSPEPNTIGFEDTASPGPGDCAP